MVIKKTSNFKKVKKKSITFNNIHPKIKDGDSTELLLLKGIAKGVLKLLDLDRVNYVLICVNNKNNKFYVIRAEFSILYTFYGKIGTIGSSIDRDYGTTKLAELAMIKLVKSKLAKGYVNPLANIKKKLAYTSIQPKDTKLDKKKIKVLTPEAQEKFDLFNKIFKF